MRGKAPRDLVLWVFLAAMLAVILPAAVNAQGSADFYSQTVHCRCCSASFSGRTAGDDCTRHERVCCPAKERREAAQAEAKAKREAEKAELDRQNREWIADQKRKAEERERERAAKAKAKKDADDAAFKAQQQKNAQYWEDLRIQREAETAATNARNAAENDARLQRLREQRPSPPRGTVHEPGVTPGPSTLPDHLGAIHEGVGVYHDVKGVVDAGTHSATNGIRAGKGLANTAGRTAGGVIGHLAEEGGALPGMDPVGQALDNVNDSLGNKVVQHLRAPVDALRSPLDEMLKGTGASPFTRGSWDSGPRGDWGGGAGSGGGGLPLQTPSASPSWWSDTPPTSGTPSFNPGTLLNAFATDTQTDRERATRDQALRDALAAFDPPHAPAPPAQGQPMPPLSPSAHPAGSPTPTLDDLLRAFTDKR